MKRTNRKRISVICIAVLVIAAAVYMLPAGHPGILQNETDDQYLGFSTEAALDSITIKWKPRDHVDYYEICRLDISENGDSIPALKEYEKIASVNGEKRSYTDTDTVPGHTYAYVITGFRKSFGRSKQICTSFEENCVTYETAGPAKPGLLNNGNGENYENSKDKIYLYLIIWHIEIIN